MRIYERMTAIEALAPVAAASGAETATGYVDISGLRRLTFIVQAGADASCEAFGANDSSGTGAMKIGETLRIAKGSAAVELRLRAELPEYVSLKLTQSSGAEAVIGVTALAEGRFTPEPQGNAFEV